MICRGTFGCGDDRRWRPGVIDPGGFSSLEFLNVFFAYFGKWFTLLASSKESSQRSVRSALHAGDVWYEANPRIHAPPWRWTIRNDPPGLAKQRRSECHRPQFARPNFARPLPGSGQREFPG